MGVNRKLYIDNDGLEVYANSVYEQSKNNYADIIECTEQINAQLKLASRLPKIKSISVVKSGAIRFRTYDLFIRTTDCNRLRKWLVGKWEIEVSTNGSYHFKSFNKNELGFHSVVWGDNTVHPHISGRDGHGCLGNAEAGLQIYLRTGAIKALAIYVLGYLESVNLQDSAGVTLGYCKEVELDNEGNPVISEDGNYKFIQNEFDRIGHRCVTRYVDDVADTEYNEYLIDPVKCKGCGCTHNRDRLHYDAEHDITLCDSCVEHMKLCDICGAFVQEDRAIHDNINNKIYCTTCAKKYFPKCELCDEYIFYDFNGEPIEKVIANVLRRPKYLKDIMAFYMSGEKLTPIALCNSCKDAVNNNEQIKSNIISFKKSKVTNNESYVEFHNIEMHKYIGHCSSCGIDTYIEDLHALRNNDTLVCNACAISTEKSLRLSREMDRNTQRFSDKIIQEQLNNKIKLATVLLNGNIYVIKIDGDTKLGKFYNKSMINNEIVNSEDTVKTYAVNDAEEIAIDLAIKKFCNKCGKELTDKIYNDKCNKEYCQECAESTATRCVMCEKMVTLDKLGINDGDNEHQLMCKECRDIVSDEKCPICGQIMDKNNDNLFHSNNCTYHAECALEHDIAVMCDVCNNVVHMEDAVWCDVDDKYYCYDCLYNDLDACDACTNRDCMMHPDNR